LILLAVLVCISFAGGVVTVWYTYRMEALFGEVVDRHLVAYQAAEALETALVSQKGYVTYYFQDRDPDWLRQLGKHRQIFDEKLALAESLVNTERQRELIDKIKVQYKRYTNIKDDVIALYKGGSKEQGSKLHREVREAFFKTLELSNEFKVLHQNRIAQVRSYSSAQAERLRIIALGGMLLAFTLGLIIFLALVHYILGPVRRLALEANREGTLAESPNEVQSLSRSVRGLIEDYDQTHLELEKSRETLLQAEKMALVGKLAAGVAHSIRNPLTSVNMRLFSLKRTLNLEGSQREDFDVISEEIRHLDTIVQNFLEFSRRPKLRVQKISPSDVVDMTIQLLHHRLKSYDVEVEVKRNGRLPAISADPEQLKEVLVNLVINACEAMEGGGKIVISEKFQPAVNPGERMIKIAIRDNGPGIPVGIQEKVLEPFFTTKDEGTGLGLSIAVRILEEHGGKLEIASKEGVGTTTTITLPLGVTAHE